MNSLFDFDADAAALRSFAAEQRNPLRREFEAARAGINFRQFEILRGLGFPTAQLIADGKIGVVAGAIEREDYWRPEEGGESMIITPLQEDSRTVDLIAMDPHDLNGWYLRTGIAWALGMDAIERAAAPWGENAEPLILHPTPAEWLRSGGEGACVVQWTYEARASLRRLGNITVAEPAIAHRLRLELTRPPRLPDIQVRRWRRNAA